MGRVKAGGRTGEHQRQTLITSLIDEDRPPLNGILTDAELDELCRQVLPALESDREPNVRGFKTVGELRRFILIQYVRNERTQLDISKRLGMSCRSVHYHISAITRIIKSLGNITLKLYVPEPQTPCDLCPEFYCSGCQDYDDWTGLGDELEVIDEFNHEHENIF